MDAFEEEIRRLQGELNNLQGELDSIGRVIPPVDAADSPTALPIPRYNPNLRIAGVETTQGIQYFNFNGQGSGAAPNNSVVLVDNKTTILRVYPDVYQRWSGWHVPTTVTGEMWYESPPGFRWSIAPIGGPVPARPAGQVNRSNWDETLNFRLPAWQCTGSFTCTARLYDPARSSVPQEEQWRYTGGPVYPNLRFQRFAFGSDTRLRLACVRILYEGPDLMGNQGVWGPPSEEEMRNTLEGDSLLTKTFPISGINPIISPTVLPFRGNVYSSAGRRELIAQLEALRTASGSRDVFLGLLPRELWPLHWVNGVGGGVAIAMAGQDRDVARAIGYALGRLRSCCGVGIIPGSSPPECGAPVPPQSTIPVDTSFPVYGANLPGSIGEWGVDTTKNDAVEALSYYDPSFAYDLLGFCYWANEWISPYTYQALFSVLSQPRIIFAAVPEPSVEREYLHLSFRMNRKGEVRMLPSFVLSGLRPEPERSRLRSPVACELRDAAGEVIASHRCHLTDSAEWDPASPYHDFHEVVPWEGETRSILFLHDGEKVAEEEVAEQAPKIEGMSVPEFEDGSTRIRLEWEAEHVTKSEGGHDTGSLTYLVRYSNDGGETWRAVAVGLTESRFEVDLDSLPGGDECVFQIAASSTLRTSTHETDLFPVPVKARQAYIVSPEPGATFLYGEPVVLRGGGYSPDFETAPPEEVVWTSNIAGFIGYGYELILDDLAVGVHKITLGVADGLGAEGSADVNIRVNPMEEG